MKISNLFVRGKKTLLNFFENETGFAAITTAIILPATILMAGLATEGGYWYYTQRKMQNAADTAAYASILKLMHGKTGELSSIAATVAESNGYIPGIGTIAVNNPPLTGAYAGDVDAIEVTLTQSVPRYLSALMTNESVIISSRAVATLSTENLACMLSLSDAASGAVTFSGSSDTILNNCRLVVNSIAADAIIIQGSANVSVDCASTAGGAATTSGLVLTKCNSVSEYQSPVADPFAALEPMTTPVVCSDKSEFSPGPHATGNPAPNSRYCGGISVTAGRTVELSEGYYIFDGGDVKINAAATLTGDLESVIV